MSEITASSEIRERDKEIERLKRLLEEERAKVEISSEFSRFGLWEYYISDDYFCQIKKLFKNDDSDSAEPVTDFRGKVLQRGIVCADYLLAFNRFCDALSAGEEKELSCELQVLGELGNIINIKFEGKLFCDEKGLAEKYVGRVFETKSENGAQPSAGELDPLTKTYSLAAFKTLTEEKRRGANRYRNAGLLAVGIDKFREITASCGQEYSDVIQKSVAKILKDIALSERDSFAARVRDGEFLLFLTFEEVTSLGKLAKKIISGVREMIFEKANCEVSVGYSIFKNARKLDEVYGEAMAALGEARRSGGGCYMSYSPAMSMGAYAPATDITGAPDVSGLSSGASKVYDLILKAFCGKKDCVRLMKEAFRTAGEILGAAGIFVYSDDHGRFFRNLTYNAEGLPLESCPRIKRSCSDEELRELFKDTDRIRIHAKGEKYQGLELINGAVCAELRAIKYKGVTVEYFAIVFSSGFELSDQDIQIIDALEQSLTQMYGAYADNIHNETLLKLHKTIITDHRVEGFSIVPFEYRIETMGENVAEHYGLSVGDICYKKIRGREAPCENCPVLQLEKGELFASAAFFDSKEKRWLDLTASIDANMDGERRFLVSSTDITDCLGKIKIADPLTGAMTFDVFTAEALKITSVEKDANRFIAVINIADFRSVNEDNGYEAGNSILISIAEILEQCAGEGELMCRSEGSRFILLLKNESVEEFTKRLEQLLSSIQKQIFRKFKITVYLIAGAYDMQSDSTGVMGGIDRAIRAQKTIRDKAYYSANMIAFFDEALKEKIEERRFIEANMFTALENNEFQVYYQPKISITTGEVVGAEALARWIRPSGEMIPPSKFISIFEENGFITDMDFAVYRRAIADIKRWLRMDIEVPLISMNVSRHHLGDESFCAKLVSLIDSIGVPHKYIELEITESLLTDHLDRLVDTVSWFKERGFRISVDDFGSGYSSLNLITMLPFDTLKIDGGFFLKNDLTEKNKKVITSVVTLAKSLNLETVSEGVETQVQVDFLKELGCDMIQGFFYYKPMPCEEFEAVLKNQRKMKMFES